MIKLNNLKLDNSIITGFSNFDNVDIDFPYDYTGFSDFFKEKARISDGKRKRPKIDPDMIGLVGIFDPSLLDFLAMLDGKSCRRLSDKTQVFTACENSNVRNRLTHTFEVVSLSTRIAKILGLNIFMAMAIALGHDLGHVPFGHDGEKVLSELSGKNFNHGTFSVVLAQEIERKGNGLNLTRDTLNGILYHSSGDKEVEIDESLPLEFGTVKYADKISYLFADIQDIFRMKCDCNLAELEKMLAFFGKTQRERVAKCLFHLVKESCEENKISFKYSDTAKKFSELKNWMYQNVYKKISNKDFCRSAIVFLYNALRPICNQIQIDPIIFIALMTDRDVISFASQMFHKPLLQMGDFANVGAMEIAEHIRGKTIDFTNPGLDW